MKILFGIFVGGRSSRMGGVPKGLLQTGAHTIIDRLISVVGYAAGGRAELRLVGDSRDYRGYGLSEIVDDPPGIGPLGGLHGLLLVAHAEQFQSAIALACDMPYIEAPLLRLLMNHRPEAAAVSPKLAGKWQPLFARYAPSPTLAAIDDVLRRDQRGMYRVLDALGDRACELPLTDGQRATLSDWDAPSDIP